MTLKWRRSIWSESEDLFVRLRSHEKTVDAGEKLLKPATIAVLGLFLERIEPRHATVLRSDVSVHTRRDVQGDGSGTHDRTSEASTISVTYA